MVWDPLAKVIMGREKVKVREEQRSLFMKKLLEALKLRIEGLDEYVRKGLQM